jgi:hypothetical protein
LKLERVIASAGGGAVDNIREVFRDVDLADNKQVLEHTAGVRVKLRTEFNHNA